MENLAEANIETLPDGESIDGYVSGFDGTTYVFEIKLKNSTRIYSFWHILQDQKCLDYMLESILKEPATKKFLDSFLALLKKFTS